MTSDPAQTADTTAPSVSIIIISYNTRQMTLDCIQSVIDETTVPYELIVMDNASTDGSAEAIAAAYPDIQLMAEDANHGFAKANNLAAVHAKGEYLLLLNPDTLVLDRGLDKLLEFAQARPDAGIWGGRHLDGDRRMRKDACWRKLSLWNVFCRVSGLTGLFSESEFFNSEAYGGWQRDTERQVDMITGALFLIKRDFWNTLGGFDLRYIMYGEEVDLCLRAAKLGAAPRMTPNAEIIHFGGASDTVRADKMVRMMKAKLTLIEQHFPVWQRWIGRMLFGLWPWSRAQATRLKAMLKGGKDENAWVEIWGRRGEWWNGYPPLDG